MTNPVVKVKKLDPRAVLPKRGTEYAAGADLYAVLDAPLTIEPGETAFIPIGIAMEIPVGYVGLVYARSGLSCKRGLAPANKVGVIDSDYRGQLMVALHNHGTKPQMVDPSERVAQMVIAPYLAAAFEEVEQLEDTERGVGGFGSTGTK